MTTSPEWTSTNQQQHGLEKKGYSELVDKLVTLK